MSPRLLALWITSTIVAGSCFVDRRSDALKCSETTDCGAGKLCESNYCVDDPCPAACNGGCPTTDECLIVCNAVTACEEVDCPEDFDCSITCDGPGACGAVACSGRSDCIINCITADSCGNVTCSMGACDVTCNAPGACGAIDCDRACACDVACPTGNCGSQSCPGNSGPCTIQETGECSSDAASCDRC